MPTKFKNRSKFCFPSTPSGLRVIEELHIFSQLQDEDSAQNHFRPSAACGGLPAHRAGEMASRWRAVGLRTYRRASLFQMAKPVSDGRLRSSERNFVLETQSSP